METSNTEFAQKYRASGIQTLVSRAWQSRSISPERISEILNLWFQISSENPTIIIEHWQVTPVRIASNFGYAISEFVLVIQIMCPEGWDTSAVDRIVQ